MIAVQSVRLLYTVCCPQRNLPITRAERVMSWKACSDDYVDQL
jgi:hypothetical protein